MVRTTTPPGEIGMLAPDFDLPGVDGRRYRLADFQDAKALLVMFICNHCPYVKSIEDRIIRDVQELARHGVRAVAISANDPTDYPEDSFEQMVIRARDKHYPFPYLLDESQAVAQAYGAVCTPDFFGFNQQQALCYRGRLDESRKEAVADARRDLYEAMLEVAQTGKGPAQQWPSMGCSIKWKADAAV